MALSTVVKIDIAGSKKFSHTRQPNQPGVRFDLLHSLLKISRAAFPTAEEAYPKGTFYKADGDAVMFILEHASAALRASIEFMQSWYQLTTEGYPECRVFLDTGHLTDVDVPGKTELVGKPFENISIFEKGQPAGAIYLTRATVLSCDSTMAKFAFHESVSPREGELVDVFRVEFLDPRTIDDSALVHALFVAHPEAQKARERVVELFILEYLLDCGPIADVNAFRSWASTKGYPVGPTVLIENALKTSEFVEHSFAGSYVLKPDVTELLKKARADFSEARDLCLTLVATAVAASTKTERSLEGIKLQNLIDDYLSTLFSQIRLMANYFRSTSQLFAGESELLKPFDYVLHRYLPLMDQMHFEEWRTGFLSGLKQCADSGNQYVAAVFHNVLATYYVNRSKKVSAYQEDKLKERKFYIDTNTLQGLLIKASQFNDVLVYIHTQLAGLGLLMRVFPFTVDEYETSIRRVEALYHDGRPSVRLVTQNPWLLQEFELNRGKYFDRMSVCVQQHSIAKEIPVASEHFEAVDANLREKGLCLEREFVEVPLDDAKALWDEKLRHAMTRDSWELARYYEFFGQLAMRPEDLNVHDAKCVANVQAKKDSEGSDELGPKVIFLTLDSRRLLRLRHKYPFIVGPQQFLEFFLPYLFLSDIPVADSIEFPNRLLSAQLATLLVKRPPKMVEIAAAFLREPNAIEGARTGQVPSTIKRAATVLSEDRFKGITQHVDQLTEPAKDAVASGMADILDDIARRENEEYYRALSVPSQLQEKERLLEEEHRKLEKARREIAYLRGVKKTKTTARKKR